MSRHEPLPTTLTLITYDDPVVEAHGHHPASAYVDWCWTPVIGPSCVALYRRLAELIAIHSGTEPLTVSTAELVTSIGIGPGLGSQAIATRTIARLAAFDVITRDGDVLAVRRALPRHGAGRASRLPRLSRCAHDLLPQPRPSRP